MKAVLGKPDHEQGRAIFRSILKEELYQDTKTKLEFGF